ncbi:MAG: hypothetical protein D6722_19250 [Bacteroidetes bacterium]|nr:MAG: hypothetical protein D6722_19250 [Bacteroidota bacterium]
MKLILSHNHLLLKVSPEALARFKRDNKVQTAVVFGTYAGDKLIFTLETSHSYEELHVSLVANELRVFVPKPLAKDWAFGDRESFGADLDVGEGRSLHLSVVKEIEMVDPPAPGTPSEAEEAFPVDESTQEFRRKHFPYS